LGEGSPLGFYEKYGFQRTGEFYGEEPELMYRFDGTGSV
jgi:hypothetical protein